MPSSGLGDDAVKEAGIMDMFSGQQLPMRPLEKDVGLEPLKLEHFIMAGIGAGNLLALVAFVWEKVKKRRGKAAADAAAREPINADSV